MALAIKLDEDPGLSDLGTLDYLWDAFIDTGMTMDTGMGEAPLSWTEVSNFAQSTLAVDEPWELRTLHAMSAGYLRAKQAGQELLAMSPVDQLEANDDD